MGGGMLGLGQYATAMQMVEEQQRQREAYYRAMQQGYGQQVNQLGAFPAQSSPAPKDPILNEKLLLLEE